MILHWPQYAWLALAALTLIVGAVADGTPRTGTNRFSVALVGTMLSAWLLWCGGFFG
jgi:hypothetical protein